MRFELKSVQPSSIVISSLPAVLFFLGLIGGVVTFVVLPNAQADPMSGVERIMASGLFGLLYMFLMLALCVVVAFLYNLFTQTIGMKGIKLELDEIGETDNLRAKPDNNTSEKTD